LYRGPRSKPCTNPPRAPAKSSSTIHQRQYLAGSHRSFSHPSTQRVEERLIREPVSGRGAEVRRDSALCSNRPGLDVLTQEATKLGRSFVWRPWQVSMGLFLSPHSPFKIVFMGSTHSTTARETHARKRKASRPRKSCRELMQFQTLPSGRSMPVAHRHPRRAAAAPAALATLLLTPISSSPPCAPSWSFFHVPSTPPGLFSSSRQTQGSSPHLPLQKHFPAEPLTLVDRCQSRRYVAQCIFRARKTRVTKGIFSTRIKGIFLTRT